MHPMFLKKLKQKYKQKLLLFYIQDRIAELKIFIRPFYLVHEGPFYSDKDIIKPRIDNYSVGFLSDEEIMSLSEYPECGRPREELHKRIQENCRCLAIKQNGNIAGYMWCNLSHLESWLSFALQPNEAYLFDAKVFNAFKGKNIAPFLRDQLYAQLKSQGRTKYYSVTEALNTPAQKFKQKLGAKNLKLYLHIGLFNKYNTNILLRSYQ